MGNPASSAGANEPRATHEGSVGESRARLLAHEGHEHKVMGTVTMAAADHLMLKDKDGKEVTVKVTKDTKLKAKPVVKAEDIKPGTRVVVTAVEQTDKSMLAKTIEIGAVSAPS